MGKSIFQKVADRIKLAKTPKWLKEILRILRILLSAGLKAISEDMKEFLKTEILLQASSDIPGLTKLDNVVKAFRDRYTVAKISNSMLITFISSLVEMMKDSGELD